MRVYIAFVYMCTYFCIVNVMFQFLTSVVPTQCGNSMICIQKLWPLCMPDAFFYVEELVLI